MAEVLTIETRELNGTEIAVIGMSCRLPDAPDVDTFWKNVKEGKESVRTFTEEELRSRGVSDELLSNPDYVRSGVVLEDIDKFDAGFFGFSPRDASIMDPQHRIFLECAWEALEHAGYDPGQVDDAIGVFGGCGMNAYMMYHLLSNPDLMASSGEFLIRHTGNDKDFLTTRVSYELDLKGPSVNVQTACSTSLVAVHMGIQSLLAGESDLALAGGVTVSLDQEKGYLFQPGEILSPDGHCRPFDAKSQGTIFGSGAGIVVLKRLAEAIEDGDTIHAVLLGSAINNDGRAKVGYMAPSVDGQAAVVAEALSVAGVAPRDISYIEAHGTGTPVGDPIEITALTQVHRSTTEEVGYCSIGSLKSNIGHLDTAAGVAGLIKTIQALKHRVIPHTLHFEEPNPNLELETSPFYVQNQPKEWDVSNESPRRAGVSSLGVGGTNAHVVVEEAPRPTTSSSSKPWHFIGTSAKTESAVQHGIERLAAFADATPDAHAADISYTLHVGRKDFANRRFAICASDEQLGNVLRNPEAVHGGIAPSEQPQLAFMFAGGGVQHPRMGLDLYEAEPVYRREIDKGLNLLRNEGLDLRPLLFPEVGQTSEDEMEKPSIGLPALFITQMALVGQLKHWGINPDAVIGHSVGEYAAACTAGVMKYEDALRLVALRGRLFETLPKGGMLSVALTEENLRDYLSDDLDIAAVNAADLCVVSGPVEALANLSHRLEIEDIDSARLKIAVAAHSSMVEQMLEPYEQFIKGLSLQPPRIPFASNLSGTWVSDEEAVSPKHWAQHVRETVRFADGLNALLSEPNRILVEVGPGRALSTLARQHQLRQATQPVISTMRHPRESADDHRVLVGALGHLWVGGAKPDWRAYYQDERRRRIPLPTYPFERQRFWIEAGNVVFSEAQDESSINRKDEISEWFETPVWSPADLPEIEPPSGRWLVFHGGGVQASAVIDELRSRGAEVAAVEIGKALVWEGRDICTVSATSSDDFGALRDTLEAGTGIPDHVVFLDIDPKDGEATTDTFYAVFNCIHALGSADPDISLELHLVTHESQAVVSEDSVGNPRGALLLGPARVLPKEFPNIRAQFVDVDADARAEIIVDAICVKDQSDAHVIAYRGKQTYHVRYDSAHLEDSDQVSKVFKEEGVYLITGGFGGIGLSLAHHLVDCGVKRIALLGRLAKSPRSHRLVRALAASGAEILALPADVSNHSQMSHAMALIQERFGTLTGVFHAAGTLADAPVLLKSAGQLESVLAPKVGGTEVLESVLAGHLPDFVVLFSSTSSVLGLAGQIDYAAANAFVNSFAAWASKKHARRFVAVNWGMWRDVGMAARLSESKKDPRFEAECQNSLNHGLLLKSAELEGGELLLCGELSTAKDWVVDQHRLNSGQALLPGTAFLDFAYTALKEAANASAIEMSHTTFVSALSLPNDHSVPLRVLVESSDSGYDFAIVGEHHGAWIEHAVGSGSVLTEDRPRLDLEDAFARCIQGDVHYDESHPRSQQPAYLSLGKRWDCVQRVRLGDSELVAELELPDAFASDESQFNFHPALLDMATGVGLDLLPGGLPPGLFVPLVYERVRAWGPIPHSIISCVQLQDFSATSNVARFDIQLCSPGGLIHLEVIGLAVKLIPSDELGEMGQPRRGHAQTTSPIERLLDQGIRVEEGMEALERILVAETGPEVIASPISLNDLAKSFATSSNQSSAKRAAGVGLPSGDGMAADATPRDEIEAKLVGLWEDLLGASSVGIHDNFFDLGGHSLLAVRLFARLERHFDKALPLATLFEAPTPAKLGVLVRGGYVEEELDVSVSGSNGSSNDNPTNREFLVAIQGGKEGAIPFFCVHGAGGNVLNFRDLAVRIGREQPFYGLQARGVDGIQAPHSTVEEMAEGYLEEIRLVQASGPYFLGGYSGGGVVAFEMARLLEALGEDVGALIFLDTFRPGIVDEEGIRGRHANLNRMLDRGPRYILDWAKRRYEFEKWRRTKSKMEDLIQNRQQLPLEMREIQMTAAYHAAADQYEIRPLSGVQITLFTADNRAAEHENVGDDLGWEPFAAGGLDIRFVAGDHDSLMREPNVQALAKELRNILELKMTAI